MGYGFGKKDVTLFFLILILILFSLGNFGGSFGKCDDDNLIFLLILVLILFSSCGGFCSLSTDSE